MRTRVAAAVLAAFAGTLVFAGGVEARPSGSRSGGHSGGHAPGRGSHGGGGSHAVPRSGYANPGHGYNRGGSGHNRGGGHGYYRGGSGYNRGGGHGYYRGGGNGYHRGGGHGYYRGGHGYYRGGHYGHYGRGYYPYYGYGYYPYGYYPYGWGLGLGLSFYYDNTHYVSDPSPYYYDPPYGAYPQGGERRAEDPYAIRDERVGAPADAARGAGELRLRILPADASVYVDGEFRGTASRLGTLWLAPGRHRVEVVRPGYRTYDRDVDVSGEAPASIEVELER